MAGHRHDADPLEGSRTLRRQSIIKRMEMGMIVIPIRISFVSVEIHPAIHGRMDPPMPAVART